MDEELPPWLRLRSENPVLRDVLQSLLQNQTLAKVLSGRFGGESGEDFSVFVGDSQFLNEYNASRQKPVRIDPNTGGVALYSPDARGAVQMGGIVIDVDKLHGAVQQDSARARDLVRDALLHELAHLMPVAESRHIKSRTGDPRPGDKNAGAHPVMVGEAKLRELLGLPARQSYSLLFDR